MSPFASSPFFRFGMLSPKEEKQVAFFCCLSYHDCMDKKPDRRYEYSRRMRAAGFRLVCVWVPDGLQDKVKALAARLRGKT